MLNIEMEGASPVSGASDFGISIYIVDEHDDRLTLVGISPVLIAFGSIFHGRSG